MARAKAPYAQQEKGATAVNILKSWLKATGIKVEGTGRGLGRMVVVGAGGRKAVQVVSQRTEIDPECVKVNASALTGKRFQTALEAFWSVTDAIGEPRRNPIDRGSEPEQNQKGNPKKLHYKEHFHDVVIRHTEFRRSVNPDPAVFEKYKPTMHRVAWGFMRLHSQLCARNSLDIEDLLQYARCWIVNFCSRYQTNRPMHFDNERKLYRYLQQRFYYDLYPLLMKQERSTLPDAETVAVALFNDPAGSDSCTQDEVEELDEAYKAAHCRLDTSSEAKRKVSATAMLDQLLKSLPHDEMVERLLAATTSNYIDVSARKEAAKRLKAHQNRCRACVSVAGEMDEDPTRLDAAGGAEEIANV